MLKLIIYYFVTLSIFTISFAQEDPWASIEDFADTPVSSILISSQQLYSEKEKSSNFLASSSVEAHSESIQKEIPKTNQSLKQLMSSSVNSSSRLSNLSSSFLSSSSIITPSPNSPLISSNGAQSSSGQTASVQWKKNKKPAKPMVIVEIEEDEGENIIFDNTENTFGQGPTNLQIKKRSTFNNIEDFRSPKTAFFSSLVLPGAGQAYVATGQGGWLRASIWFVSEAALWTGLYKYGLEAKDKALREQDEAYKKWSFQKYETFISDSLKQARDNQDEDSFTEEFLTTRFDYCRSIHSQEDLRDICENFSETRYKEHLTLIQNPNFEIDEKTQLLKILTYNDYLSGWSINGQTELSDAIDEEEKARDMASLFLTGIIFNHLLSALDAAWMAYSGNKALYKPNSKPSMTGLQGYLRPDMQGQVQWKLSLTGEF